MNKLEAAFKLLPRENFLPLDQRPNANFDRPLPIGYGQTNSQPSTVQVMLEWLNVQPGNKVLDVGSGSGWTTALLSFLVKPSGRVYAVEKIPKLVEFGRQNCQKMNLKNIEFFQAGATFGLLKYVPYDRILVSASASSLPNKLIEQLKPGGKLVVPVQNDILEITKNDKVKIISHHGFIFVPLI